MKGIALRLKECVKIRMGLRAYCVYCFVDCLGLLTALPIGLAAETPGHRTPPCILGPNAHCQMPMKKNKAITQPCVLAVWQRGIVRMPLRPQATGRERLARGCFHLLPSNPFPTALPSHSSAKLVSQHIGCHRAMR